MVFYTFSILSDKNCATLQIFNEESPLSLNLEQRRVMVDEISSICLYQVVSTFISESPKGSNLI